MDINIWICPVCNNEFFQKTSTQKTCSDKNCRHKESYTQKKIKHHLALENLRLKTKIQSKKEYSITSIIKTNLLKDMEKEVWHQYCQGCWEKEHMLEAHHIIKRSELRNHLKKHCKKNIILLGSWFSKCQCHSKFHANEHLRDKWVIERRLWEVFEIVRKERYLTL